MKMLPRQSKPRRPVQGKRSNHSVGGPRVGGTKHPMESEQLVTMIDDYLSTFAIHSPDPPRPSSSGTMFVDFGADGHLEVSYRNGINKKLPTPPVPSKIPGPSNPASPRHTVEIKQRERTKREQRTETNTKPRSKRPSQSSRHDSVLDPSVNQRIDISLPPQFPPPNWPLPHLPSQTPEHLPSSSHRPQKYSSPRTASTTKAPYSSPALSTTSYHTACNETKAAYTAIEPEFRTAPFQSGGLTTSSTVTPAAYARAARVKSYPESQKPKHLDIPISTGRSSANASIYASSTHVPLRMMDTNKPLPPLPPVPRSQELKVSKKKRHSIVQFVKKVLQTIEGRR